MWYDTIEVTEDGKAPDEVKGLKFQDLSEKVSYVLVEKCEGDARTRIRTRKMAKGYFN